MSDSTKIASLNSASLAYPAGNTAIDKMSLEIFPAEIVGLVGSNGSGKTTLLKLISGYMALTGGGIDLGGKPIEDFSERMLNDYVTLVEQNPENQLSGPTVEDELARACRMIGLKGREIDNRVTSVLKDINLVEAREWFLDEISAGERRRVALGLALLEQPKLLLLDEPLSDLDEEGVQTTIAFLNKYRNKGVAIVVTAHKLDDLIKITDRIAILSKGQLLNIAPTAEVLRDQENLSKASVMMPPLSKLAVELEQEGIISFDKFPLSYEEVKNCIVHSLQKAS